MGLSEGLEGEGVIDEREGIGKVRVVGKRVVEWHGY